MTSFIVFSDGGLQEVYFFSMALRISLRLNCVEYIQSYSLLQLLLPYFQGRTRRFLEILAISLKKEFELAFALFANEVYQKQNR